MNGYVVFSRITINTMTDLINKNCLPIAAGTPALSADMLRELGQQVPEWSVVDGKKIRRVFKFKSYLVGAKWVPELAELAEREDHHPDIQLLYRKVIVELWTHTVNGLSENDYILAAKIDRVYLTYNP
jgi:4a-hydroxytetrahydrobiopterin dehydratase